MVTMDPSAVSVSTTVRQSSSSKANRDGDTSVTSFGAVSVQAPVLTKAFRQALRLNKPYVSTRLAFGQALCFDKPCVSTSLVFRQALLSGKPCFSTGLAFGQALRSERRSVLADSQLVALSGAPELFRLSGSLGVTQATISRPRNGVAHVTERR